jgi:hypothetical protein
MPLSAADREKIRREIDARKRQRELVQLPDGTWRRVLPGSKVRTPLMDTSPALATSPGRSFRAFGQPT